MLTRALRHVAARESRILAYHGLGRPDPSVDPDWLRVDPQRFRAQLGLLRDAGFEFVTVSELVGRWLQAGHPPTGLVALSFDDGMEDNRSVLLPILGELGATATVYVVTGLAGLPNPWLAPAARQRMLTREELLELHAAGVELGAHTVTHPDLSTLDRAACVREMAGSRAWLEELIQAPVTSFAYPFCRYGPEAVAAAEEVGFASAATCHCRGGWEPYTLARCMITGRDDLTAFALKVAGVYEPLFHSRAGAAVRRATRAPRRALARRHATTGASPPAGEDLVRGPGVSDRPSPRADEELLRRVADAAPGGVLLWRGPPSPTSSDIDLLVMPWGRVRVARALSAAGLRPRPGDPGHVVWEGGARDVDVLDAEAWPDAYPSLVGVVARSFRAHGAALPASSPADRVLVLAADVVAGRPAGKLAPRAAALLTEPIVARRAHELAAGRGDDALVGVVDEPRTARGRLTYPAAIATATRSPAARAALRDRVLGRLGVTPARQRGLVIALSGLDGAGKSTLADAVRAGLEERGRPVAHRWTRLGTEDARLSRIAAPVRRLLGRDGTIADPVAAGGPTVTKRQDAREAGDRSLVAWGWVVVVAGTAAITARRAARARAAGFDVVCDRWRTDAVVDLRLRYGRHRVAEALLRHAVPRPDVAVLLALDAGTAADRKPGDQDPGVLRRAEALYAERSCADGLAVLDATSPSEELAARVLALVDDRLGTAPSRAGTTPRYARLTTGRRVDRHAHPTVPRPPRRYTRATTWRRPDVAKRRLYSMSAPRNS